MTARLVTYQTGSHSRTLLIVVMMSRRAIMNCTYVLSATQLSMPSVAKIAVEPTVWTCPSHTIPLFPQAVSHD